MFTHLDWFLGGIWRLYVEEEWLPRHVELDRGRRRISYRRQGRELFDGIFQVALSNEAPGTNVVAENLICGQETAEEAATEGSMGVRFRASRMYHFRPVAIV